MLIGGVSKVGRRSKGVSMGTSLRLSLCPHPPALLSVSPPSLAPWIEVQVGQRMTKEVTKECLRDWRHE